MATIQREIRKRSVFGKIVKWLFILFNILMVVWLFRYLGFLGEQVQTAASDAERAGTAIGGTIGVGFVIFFWACGSIILGIVTLLTRGQKILITEDL